jgi:ADP-heptose:LPS heptosyltransferase
MMLYRIHNPAKALCVFFDGRGSVSIKPGATADSVALNDQIKVALIRVWPELVIEPLTADPAFKLTGKEPLRVNGMNGIGDCIHQRSVMRELMKKHDVWLATCHWHMYADLIDEGLKLIFQATRFRAQAKTIERERHLFVAAPPPPPNTHEIKLWYKKPAIDEHGSILEAMHANCWVKCEKPDFSLPVPLSWDNELDAKVKIDTGGKPLMVLRPIVIRPEWNSRNRNPDPAAYQTLYEEARNGFYVISVADIAPPDEVIEGPELDADLKLHRGELTFQELAALWRRASLVFANAGFGPVLAQAVGTPSVVVYGGRESYRTTDRAGAHLAPTLGIDPIHPCDCHSESHHCGDKKIDIPAALDRLRPFVDQYRTRTRAHVTGTPVHGTETPLTAGMVAAALPSSTLIFGTIYVDGPERQRLTEQWLTLNSALNPDCDLLLVDSASPVPLVHAGFAMPPRAEVFNFGDNVGHLSRKGRDGWGRAFTKGLDLAVERGYRHVLHIEGDSLLRVPAEALIKQLPSGKGVGSVIVKGMHREFSNWLETGLMLFTTDYLKRSQFTRLYDWPKREVRPTPEMIVYGLIGSQFHPLKLNARRGDKNEITHENVLKLDLDWVTHCHNDIEVYAKFLKANLPPRVNRVNSGKLGQEIRTKIGSPVISETSIPSITVQTGLKINLGCGLNKLSGWVNHDIDVDITRRLPWDDGAAECIFIEHCVEHVSCHEAIRFFEEAHRVLRPGGVLRVVVPSIEQIRKLGTKAYFDFTKKFGGDGTLHGALRCIIFEHGHQMIWTASVMREALLYAGFAVVEERAVGGSPFEALRNVEGHGKMIGDAFNLIESMAFEAVKGGGEAVQRPDIAVVVGGAPSVAKEIADTRELLDRVGATAVRWFVTNDMLELFPYPCTAVSLHPDLLAGWLRNRADKGYPRPDAVWGHRKDDPRGKEITHAIEDWRGSSGLFAVKVARHLEFTRIILCGVPMDPDVGNVRGTDRWQAAHMFRTGWLTHHEEIAPYVRSWSGWTRQRLGTPDEAFLLGLMRAA